MNSLGKRKALRGVAGGYAVMVGVGGCVATVGVGLCTELVGVVINLRLQNLPYVGGGKLFALLGAALLPQGA